MCVKHGEGCGVKHGEGCDVKHGEGCGVKHGIQKMLANLKHTLSWLFI